LAVLLPQGLQLGAVVGAAGALGLGGGDGLVDAAGVVLGGLAGAASLLGLLGDGAAAAAQDGGGIADPSQDG
jgi:hypothetical protein